MTKLLQWLFVGVLFLGPWTAMMTGNIQSPWIVEHRNLILYLPVLFVIIFGFYAASVVLYRTFTFNNCEEASQQLQKVRKNILLNTWEFIPTQN